MGWCKSVHAEPIEVAQPPARAQVRVGHRRPPERTRADPRRDDRRQRARAGHRHHVALAAHDQPSPIDDLGRAQLGADVVLERRRSRVDGRLGDLRTIPLHQQRGGEGLAVGQPRDVVAAAVVCRHDGRVGGEARVQIGDGGAVPVHDRVAADPYVVLDSLVPGDGLAREHRRERDAVAVQERADRRDEEVIRRGPPDLPGVDAGHERLDDLVVVKLADLAIAGRDPRVAIRIDPDAVDGGPSMTRPLHSCAPWRGRLALAGIADRALPRAGTARLRRPRTRPGRPDIVRCAVTRRRAPLRQAGRASRTPSSCHARRDRSSR